MARTKLLNLNSMLFEIKGATAVNTVRSILALETTQQ